MSTLTRTLAVLLVVTLGWSANASAQDEREQARTLFTLGLEAHDAGDDAAAEQLFRRSLELDRSPSTVFNLATLLDEDGRSVEALQLYQEVAASERVPDDVMEVARARIAALGPRVADDLQIRSTTTTIQVPVERQGPELLGPSVLFSSAGALVVGLSITGGLAVSTQDRLLDSCPTTSTCPPDRASDIDTLSTLAVTTDVLLGLAVATATAAAIWLIVELLQ